MDSSKSIICYLFYGFCSPHFWVFSCTVTVVYFTHSQRVNEEASLMIQLYCLGLRYGTEHALSDFFLRVIARSLIVGWVKSPASCFHFLISLYHLRISEIKELRNKKILCIIIVTGRTCLMTEILLLAELFLVDSAFQP